MTGDPQARLEALGPIPAVVPVVTIPDGVDAVSLARALCRGGLDVIEVVLRTPFALQSIERIAAEVPEARVGAGTVTSPEQVSAARRVGARFLVLPGSPRRLVDAALDSGLAVLPAASTVTEMMTLAERGFRTLKFFPAEAVGGVRLLSAVGAPLPELRFCPTGGVSVANAGDYLALPNVPFVGGSWVCPGDALRDGDWARVEALSAEAASLSPRT
jgi:2-dehydro-3-deoxyphosphogluconate aldolase/(4S)-4-hydroxy-2-oxoglutarate aldolase